MGKEYNTILNDPGLKWWQKFVFFVFAPLIEKGKISVGRVLLASCFWLAMSKWYNDVNLTDSHEGILMALMLYVVSGKSLDTVKEIMTKAKEIKATADEIKNSKADKKEEE